MKRLLKMGILSMALFGWSCSTASGSVYTKNEVHSAVVSGETLKVSVLGETVFYIAGGRIIEKTDSETTLQLIRCKIKKTCKVDIPATYNSDDGTYELPVTTDSVIIDFGDGSQLRAEPSN